MFDADQALDVECSGTDERSGGRAHELPVDTIELRPDGSRQVANPPSYRQLPGPDGRIVEARPAVRPSRRDQ